MYYCPGGLSSNTDRTECIKCREGEVALDGICGKCPPGQMLQFQGDVQCTECDMSTFKASEGQGPCLPCPRNAFSMAGATKCTTCPEGKAMMKNGKCESCPPGSYRDYYAFRCRKCDQGEFQPYENIRDSCFMCSGDTTSKKGATACVKCPFSEVPMKNGTCGLCPPGTFYDSHSLDCRKCTVNYYSRGKGIDRVCNMCPRLSYALPGATECFACPAGQALVVKQNKGDCKSCPTGTYYDQNSAECTDCGDESVSRGEAVTPVLPV